MKASYSLYKIASPLHIGFNPDDYSRFKFGDGVVARVFGTQLAEGFIKEHLSVRPIDKQIVVVSSPYSFIPTATFAMKTHFVFSLNRWLAARGYPVVQETKVHRTVTYKEDYGELNAEERIQLIGNDAFHIDRSFLEGKTVLFLDDIRITGGHERMILKMAREYGLTSDLYMLYFAELVGTDVHPNIENFLNYHFVKSIFDLEGIIHGDEFIINTRIVKYILHYDFEAFCIFVQNQPEAFIALLYDMALGNGYHTIEAYQKNLEYIRHLHKYNLSPYGYEQH
jgi:PRTase ComF-like